MRNILIFGSFCIHSVFKLGFARKVLNILSYPTMGDKGVKLDKLLMKLEDADKRAKELSSDIQCIRSEIALLIREVRSENAVRPKKTQRTTILLDNVPSSSNYGERSSKRLKTTEVNGSSSDSKGCIGKNNSIKDASTDKVSDSDSWGNDLPDSVIEILDDYESAKAEFQREDNYVIVYTDGACERNGRPNAKAGIGVWFGDNHPLNISRPVVGKATNNAAEIQACIAACEVLQRYGIRKVKLHTDSKFTLDCICTWIKGWKANGWKTGSGKDVINKKDIMKLDECISNFDDVKWVHVKGHNGVYGNEAADKLARLGAAKYQPK